MSLPPEAPEARDPAGDRPKPLLGVMFWAMIVLMLVCVVSGVVIANYGPRIFGGRPAPKAAAERAGEARPALAV